MGPHGRVQSGRGPFYSDMPLCLVPDQCPELHSNLPFGMNGPFEATSIDMFSFLVAHYENDTFVSPEFEETTEAAKIMRIAVVVVAAQHIISDY